MANLSVITKCPLYRVSAVDRCDCAIIRNCRWLLIGDCAATAIAADGSGGGDGGGGVSSSSAWVYRECSVVVDTLFIIIAADM